MSNTSQFRRLKRKMERDIKKGIKSPKNVPNELRLPTVNEMEDYIKTKIEEFNKPTDKIQDTNNNFSEYELIED